MAGRVLILAGTDPSGGAGVQADIKTVTALGGFATSAITALVAQNTMGVTRVIDVPLDFIVEQMRLVLSDIGTDAVKVGMLHRTEIIEAVADVLVEEAPDAPLVVDPVMIAKSGDALLEPSAVDAMRTRMAARATVLTPNLREAEALSGMSIESLDDQHRAAERLLALGPRAVLLKGGHRAGKTVYDLLLTTDGAEMIEHPRLNTTSTHGTGCTLSSAIAVGLAQGLDVRSAVHRALDYTHEAIRTAPGYGHGCGPLNHAHTVVKP